MTVGVFDGVHRAHQQLVRVAVAAARRINGTSVAMTFDPDPHCVLNPQHAHPSLMPLDVRAAYLLAAGIDRVWILPFTKRFAQMSARRFIQQLLLRRLRASVFIVGETFAFGRNRQGGMELLRRMGRSHGMRVVAMRQVTHAGSAISSSRLRRLIARGNLSLARRLLGRPVMLYGTVVRGIGRGRRLGFPTANIRLSSEVLPPQGVYAVQMMTPVGQVLGRRSGRIPAGGGVMNLGIRPTFGPGPLVCEVHLLGVTKRLLGRAVAIALLARLRSERRFPAPQALSRQIRRDISHARRLLAKLS